MIMFYVTCKDMDEAEHIACELISSKLIKCANIFPITSVHCWRGETVKDNEVVLILKAREKDRNKIVKAVKKMHSYDVPCILSWDVKANKKFSEWINE